MSVLKNAKHEAVLQAFLADEKRVGWRAYKKIYRGSSQRAAETAWSRLMKNAEFAGRLAELTEKVAEALIGETIMTAREVLEELTKIGRSNLGRYFNGDNTFVGMGKLTAEQTAAMSGLEIKPHIIKIGRGKAAKVRIVDEVKFKLHDKRQALNDLGRHHKLFGGDLDLGGDVIVEIRKFSDGRGASAKTKRAA